MKYKLLVRKIEALDKRYISSEEIKKYCGILGLSYREGIIYLVRTKRLHRILRGVFYRPTLEERRHDLLKVDHMEAIAYALGAKGIANWYLGLDTALKLNNLTHEFFPKDYIVNDSFSRTIKVLNNTIVFVKFKAGLFSFGTIYKGNLRYSDPEKTILDNIYLDRYHGRDEYAIRNSIAPYVAELSRKKLNRYAKKYNNKMISFIDTI